MKIKKDFKNKQMVEFAFDNGVKRFEAILFKFKEIPDYYFTLREDPFSSASFVVSELRTGLEAARANTKTDAKKYALERLLKNNLKEVFDGGKKLLIDMKIKFPVNHF